jgi:hypothetical protein
VQTPSIAVNALAPVRDTRNTPAMDCTSIAPPTLANAVPSVVTRTLVPVNTPVLTPSSDGVLPGDEGDDGEDDELPLQAVNSVASVTPDAAWHAPLQNCRREIEI